MYLKSDAGIYGWSIGADRSPLPGCGTFGVNTRGWAEVRADREGAGLYDRPVSRPPEPKMPDPMLTIAVAPATSGVDKATADRVMRKRKPKLAACFATSPPLIRGSSIHVDATVVVAPTGVLKVVTIDRSTSGADPVKECVRRELEELSFPRLGKDVATIRVSLTFASTAPKAPKHVK